MPREPKVKRIAGDTRHGIRTFQGTAAVAGKRRASISIAHAPLGTREALRPTSDEQRAADVWAGLCDLGVPGMLIAEEHGGIGLSLLDAALVAETLGSRVRPCRLWPPPRWRRWRLPWPAPSRSDPAGCRPWPRAAPSPAPRMSRGGQLARAAGVRVRRLEAQRPCARSFWISRPTCISSPTEAAGCTWSRPTRPDLRAAAGHDRRHPAAGRVGFR